MEPTLTGRHHRISHRRTIRLEVEENNQSAYTFYHNHGFRETESKEERVEGDVIKVKVMEKLIP